MPTRERTAASVETLALLWAARETGILDALLTSAGSPAEIAAETDTTERAVRATVHALAAEGFFERVGESHEPTNRALGLLAKTDVRSIGRLPNALDRFDALAALPETMRTGDPPERLDDRTRNRLGAVAATDESVLRACVTAAVRERPAADRVLDLGGAPGTYAEEFAARGCDVTLVDRPDAVDVARPSLSHEPIDLATDDDPLPEADLAFVPAVDRRRTADEYRDLFGRLYDALDADGAVVVVDRLADRSAGATADAIAALASGERGPHDAAAYREWLGDAGFATVEVRDVPGTERQAVTGSEARD
jgi:hypothetical protein